MSSVVNNAPKLEHGKMQAENIKLSSQSELSKLPIRYIRTNTRLDII